MPAPSLCSLCVSALTKNIDQVTDVGEMEWGLLRPALLKIQSPQQLQLLERNSPQLLGHTAEIWRKLITRDYPALVSRTGITDPVEARDWYSVYVAFKEREVAEMNAAVALLRKSMAKDTLQREQNAVAPPTKIIVPRQSRSRPFGWSKQTTPRLFANNGIEKIRRGLAQTSALRRRTQPAPLTGHGRNPILPASARSYDNTVGGSPNLQAQPVGTSAPNRSSSIHTSANLNLFGASSKSQPIRKVFTSSPLAAGPDQVAAQQAGNPKRERQPVVEEDVEPGNKIAKEPDPASTRTWKRARDVNCLRPVKRTK